MFSTQWTESSVDCRSPSNFVRGHTSTTWFMVGLWQYVQRSDVVSCGDQPDSVTDVSENDWSSTMNGEIDWIQCDVSVKYCVSAHLCADCSIVCGQLLQWLRGCSVACVATLDLISVVAIHCLYVVSCPVSRQLIFYAILMDYFISRLNRPVCLVEQILTNVVFVWRTVAAASLRWQINCLSNKSCAVMKHTAVISATVNQIHTQLPWLLLHHHQVIADVMYSTCTNNTIYGNHSPISSITSQTAFAVHAHL